MSAQPLEFHTREQLAAALKIQREVTEDQRLELSTRAERIAILEARLARQSDLTLVTLRAEVLAWMIREQREIVYRFNDHDISTMWQAYEATGDDASRKVATWIVGILFTDFVINESALRAALRQVCSKCSDTVCDGQGCADGSTGLQVPVSVLRLMQALRPLTAIHQ
jgi:hypothetical protein